MVAQHLFNSKNGRFFIFIFSFIGIYFVQHNFQVLGGIVRVVLLFHWQSRTSFSVMGIFIKPSTTELINHEFPSAFLCEKEHARLMFSIGSKWFWWDWDSYFLGMSFSVFVQSVWRRVRLLIRLHELQVQIYWTKAWCCVCSSEAALRLSRLSVYSSLCGCTIIVFIRCRLDLNLLCFKACTPVLMSATVWFWGTKLRMWPLHETSLHTLLRQY